MNIRHTILWSPLPVLPLVWFGIISTRNLLLTGSTMYTQHLMLAAASLLGIFGCIGLVLSAFPVTYRKKQLRSAALIGLAGGFGAVGVIILAFAHTLGITGDEPVSENGIIRVLFVVLLLLALVSWPFVAGLTALRTLRRAITEAGTQ